MPSSGWTGQVVPGPSRKRSHADITKSESRSPSVQPPTKRRRTISTPVALRSTSPASTASSAVISGSARFVGDGLDFRAPRMSGTNNSTSQPLDTIDLTLDDDTPPPATDYTRNDHVAGAAREQFVAPPFGYIQQNEVIDLSNDDDEEREPVTNSISAGDQPRPIPISSSPEVQFIRERVLPVPAGGLGQTNRASNPQEPSGRRRMLDIIRGTTLHLFGNLRGTQDRLEDFILDRIDGLNRQPGGHHAGQLPMDPDYDDLQMDYTGAAFNIGGDFQIEDPPAPPAQNSDYKTPPPAVEGYTRTFDEDDVLVCGFCGDELATGADEVKQQVWVIKQCGHTYCGGCATSRVITKQANNKDRKAAAKARKAQAFKACTVPGCGKDVKSKPKMFQIYL